MVALVTRMLFIQANLFTSLIHKLAFVYSETAFYWTTVCAEPNPPAIQTKAAVLCQVVLIIIRSLNKHRLELVGIWLTCRRSRVFTMGKLAIICLGCDKSDRARAKHRRAGSLRCTHAHARTLSHACEWLRERFGQCINRFGRSLKKEDDSTKHTYAESMWKL